MRHTFEDLAFGFIEKRRPHAKRTGFWRTIYSQFMTEELGGTTFSEWKRDEAYQSTWAAAHDFRPDFLPDLFEFYPDHDWREIVLWEVEDMGKLTPEKMERIQNWMGRMDLWSAWDFKLIVTNRYGQGWTTIIDTREDAAETMLRLRADPDHVATLLPEMVACDYSDVAIATTRRWRCDDNVK